MAEKKEDDHRGALGGTKTTPEQTAAIYAAMMEELGIARKDTLPLEDKKGTGGPVDLNALDRDKKANDPRTAEFRIAQKNASARSAWNNAVFDDVNEADHELDNMNSGQSHRQRMKAELEASSSSRGGYATRGGRGSQLARGGGTHSVLGSKPGGFFGRGSSRQDPVDTDKVLARLGGRSVPQRRANSGMRGNPRGGFTKPFKRADDVVAPKPNLSFDDNRSVNVLPFGRDIPDKGTLVSDRGSRERLSAPKACKPNNYNQGFTLASPEDFLAQSWAGKSGNNAFSGDQKENVALHGSPNEARKPQTIITSTSGTEVRDIPGTTAPSATSTDVQRPSERPTVGKPVDSSNDIAHSASVQVGTEVRGNVVMIGSGTVSIKAVDQDLNIAKIVQIEVLGEMLLKEPLLESFELKLDFCTISFCSGSEGNRIKWILTASLPGIAVGVAEALERLKPRSTYIGTVDTPAEDRAGKIVRVEGGESLISLSDDDPSPPQAVSQFTEDLFSLMGDQFIEDAVSAINVKIGQNSPTMPASEIPGSCELEHGQKQQDTFHGLSASRFANHAEVRDFLNRSVVFQKLPDSTAAFIKGQVSNRLFEEARKDACDQQVFNLVKQQPRNHYSIETLMSLRSQSSSARKPSGLDLCAEYSPKDEPRPLFGFSELAGVASDNPRVATLETPIRSTSSTTGLGVPLVSGRETARKLPGLANSMHAGPQPVVVFPESTDSKELEPSASNPAQEASYPTKPDSCAPKPIRGLSSSKYASSPVKPLSREHLNAKKPVPTCVKSTVELSSSKDLPSYPVKAFKSFLNSQEHKPSCPKPFHGLPVSSFTCTPLAQLALEDSTSIHSQPASSEPLQGLSTADHSKPLVMKPFQGLASSKYACPIASKHGAIKINLSSAAKSGPKNPAFVAKSSIPKTTLNGQKHKKMTQKSTVDQDEAGRLSKVSMTVNSQESKEMDSNVVDLKLLTGMGGTGAPPSPICATWNTWRRRDSFSSHVSKDSNDTVKPLLPKQTVTSLQDHTVPLRASRAVSHDQSILSMDSSASCESFATAIEETSSTEQAFSEKNQALADGTQSIRLQAETSDFVLFLDDVTRREAIGKEHRTKSPYSSDMSELMGDSFASIPHPDPSDATLVSPFQPFKFPIAPVRKPLIKERGGLVSSRYATAAQNIAPAVKKPGSQHSSANASNEVKRGHTTEILASKPTMFEVDSSTCPQVLKPTASQFTPSVVRSLTSPMRSPPSLVGNTFSPPGQPIMATVFVEDPQWPGILREVSGLLKMGSTPVVGYIGAQNSPMGESLACGAGPANISSSQRAPLTPIRQKSENTKDKQQEIQERLTKSLAQRRLSQSQGLNGF